MVKGLFLTEGCVVVGFDDVGVHIEEGDDAPLEVVEGDVGFLIELDQDGCADLPFDTKAEDSELIDDSSSIDPTDFEILVVEVIVLIFFDEA